MDFMKAFLVMGDLTDNDRSKEDKVAYEERIVFATMKAKIPGWEKPEGWDKLPLEVRAARLAKIREV